VAVSTFKVGSQPAIKPKEEEEEVVPRRRNGNGCGPIISQNHIYTSNVSTRTPFDGAPAHGTYQTNKQTKRTVRINLN